MKIEAISYLASRGIDLTWEQLKASDCIAEQLIAGGAPPEEALLFEDLFQKYDEKSVEAEVEKLRNVTEVERRYALKFASFGACLELLTFIPGGSLEDVIRRIPELLLRHCAGRVKKDHTLCRRLAPYFGIEQLSLLKDSEHNAVRLVAAEFLPEGHMSAEDSHWQVRLALFLRTTLKCRRVQMFEDEPPRWRSFMVKGLPHAYLQGLLQSETCDSCLTEAVRTLPAGYIDLDVAEKLLASGSWDLRNVLYRNVEDLKFLHNHIEQETDPELQVVAFKRLLKLKNQSLAEMAAQLKETRLSLEAAECATLEARLGQHMAAPTPLQTAAPTVAGTVLSGMASALVERVAGPAAGILTEAGRNSAVSGAVSDRLS